MRRALRLVKHLFPGRGGHPPAAEPEAHLSPCPRASGCTYQLVLDVAARSGAIFANAALRYNALMRFGVAPSVEFVAAGDTIPAPLSIIQTSSLGLNPLRPLALSLSPSVGAPVALPCCSSPPLPPCAKPFRAEREFYVEKEAFYDIFCRHLFLVETATKMVLYELVLGDSADCATQHPRPSAATGDCFRLVHHPSQQLVGVIRQCASPNSPNSGNTHTNTPAASKPFKYQLELQLHAQPSSQAEELVLLNFSLCTLALYYSPWIPLLLF
eukprot:gnl/Spiro4/16457_TR8846_c0_g1_i2.p1 gnl/Spiro4/16457_TR8846_c0_g1~~gnl/Spiro4/16457_TR8846_c0_g1_i2.p1  ORF type:complete len:270 (-),score=54.73 gnl/Spiro4/16457_TR8846_c0_g1_i2:72-881(-)